MYWFNIRDDAGAQFSVGRFPIFIWILGQGDDFFYGFPSLDGKTVKVASEQYANVTTTPDEVDRQIAEEEKESMYKTYVRGRLPEIVGVCGKAEACLYTTTPDSNFVIDFYPGQNRILIASPCSGHGFKHSAAIGEVLAELVIDGKSKLDISSFGFGRFTS
jgi:sarcosine oxidase